MRFKLILFFILLILATRSVNSQTWHSFSPPWSYPGNAYGGYNYIPDHSTTSHVTGVELGLTASGAFYNGNILGDGVTRTPQPDAGCGSLSGTKQTLSIPAAARVTRVEAWKGASNSFTKLKLTLSIGPAVEQSATSHLTSDISHTYDIPAGQEFTGFWIGGAASGCQVTWMAVVTRPLVCSVSLDLSQVAGVSQNVITGATVTKSFTATPSAECGTTAIEYQVTYTPASTTPNLIALSTSTPPQIIFAQSTNTADAKQYTVTLNARPVGSTSWTTPAGTAAATYTYIDLCASTTLTAPTLTPMTTSVLKQSSPGGSPFYETQTATATNSVSISQSNPNFCGSYQYSISSTSTAPASTLSVTELTIDTATGVISLYTTNAAAVGTHTATVTAKLANYPSITLVTKTFQITIQACLVTSYTMLTISPVNDQSYTIANPALIWSIPLSSIQTIQVPACGYSETLTSIAAVSFIVPTVLGTEISYSAQSDNLLDAGVHTVTVTSTTTNYPSISCQQTFTVTMIDPCPTTSISTYPAKIENLVAFAGYTVVSKNQYTFNDAASVSSSLSPDLCGGKQLAFKLNGTTTSYLQSKNSDFILFSPPANTTDFGVAQATIQASMKNYATIQSPLISFPATILGSQTPNISDQTYQVNPSPLLVDFGKFKVIPLDYDAGQNKIEAYIYTGNEPLKLIDLNCRCFTNSSGMDWMLLDSQNSTLTISTYNPSNVGDHKIVLVQSFEQFLGVHPFTFFNIKIQAAPVLLDQMLPPYFAQELVPQNVMQCPGQNTTMWSFPMPKQIDPQNQTVAMTLSFDKTFFSYQMNETTIKQIIVIQKPTNKTIYATLKNKSGKKASYSMEVHFVCNITKNLTFMIKIEEQIAAATKQKQWPKAKISRIEPSGLLHVKFLQSMKIPEQPTRAH